MHSVFIGGGTPSLFSPDAIDRLLSDVRALLRPLEADAEITLEANPAPLRRIALAFREAGVTRLSVGVQSFDDRFLKALGRVHSADQARAAAGRGCAPLRDLSPDLMCRRAAWIPCRPGPRPRHRARLQPAAPVGLSPTLEPNTYFAKFPPVVPDEDTAYAMLDRITERTAAAGLARYEVSAYARAGHRCFHNWNYWQFGDYLGLGAGAHGKLSFAHRVLRQVRWRDPQLYMDNALKGQPMASEEEVAPADLPFEFMLNALRLREGFRSRCSTSAPGLPLSRIMPALQQAENKGWITRDPASLRPTERGLRLPPATCRNCSCPRRLDESGFPAWQRQATIAHCPAGTASSRASDFEHRSCREYLQAFRQTRRPVLTRRHSPAAPSPFDLGRRAARLREWPGHRALGRQHGRCLPRALAPRQRRRQGAEGEADEPARQGSGSDRRGMGHWRARCWSSRAGEPG